MASHLLKRSSWPIRFDTPHERNDVAMPLAFPMSARLPECLIPSACTQLRNTATAVGEQEPVEALGPVDEAGSGGLEGTDETTRQHERTSGDQVGWNSGHYQPCLPRPLDRWAGGVPAKLGAQPRLGTHREGFTRVTQPYRAHVPPWCRQP